MNDAEDISEEDNPIVAGSKKQGLTSIGVSDDSESSESDEEIIIKIVSAAYGPCQGQQLLNGESSSEPSAKIPFTRDVTAILRALLQMQESLKEGMEVKEEDPHLVRLKGIACGMGGMKRTSIAIQALHDGWNSMNIVFGDVCPGTSKKLYIHYVILRTQQPAQENKTTTSKQALATSEVHHVTFAENEPVILRRRVTFFQEDDKLQRATARVVAKNRSLATASSISEDNAMDEDEQTLLVARRMGRSQSITDFAQISATHPHETPSTQQSSSPSKSPRLRSATFEIVLPIVLPFLQVPDRVQCRLVCRLWRNILSDIGVAAVIDSTDPTFQHAFTRPFLRGILAHSYSSLHSLRLSNFEELCPEDLHPSLPHLRKLRVLDISCCIKLRDETLSLVSQNVHETLEVLYIKGLLQVTDSGVMAICQTCSKLKVLEVSNIPITDESGVAMGRLSNLRALYMRDNYKLTNRSIDAITANCTKLNQLTLWGCVKLRHLSFDAPLISADQGISNHHPLSSGSTKKLVSLSLWGCFKLGNGIAAALGSMKALRTLIVSECHKLSDQFVISIAQNLPQLVHLHLRYCKRVTDAGVNAIASSMNLYSLDLSFCSQVTSRSICALIEARHETLSELRLQECRQLRIVRDAEDDDGGRPRGGLDGQAMLKSLRSPTGLLGAAQSNLSMIDLRCCGGQQRIDVSYPANDPFVRGMASLQFEQRTPGFFARPARWNASMQARLEEQLATQDAWNHQ